MTNYYVVVCSDFTSLVPESWVNIKEKKVVWPAKNIKIVKKKMQYLSPNEKWQTYHFKKCLGPFGKYKFYFQYIIFY